MILTIKKLYDETYLIVSILKPHLRVLGKKNEKNRLFSACPTSRTLVRSPCSRSHHRRDGIFLPSFRPYWHADRAHQKARFRWQGVCRAARQRSGPVPV